jgi:hypothetical protein
MNSRYVVIFFSVIIIALLAFAGYRLFQGQRPKTTTPTPTPTPQVSLTDRVGSDARVRYTIVSPVAANETHNSIVITVSPANRTVQALQSYEDIVADSRDFPNNQAAFADFAQALQDAGFTKTNASTDEDERGACPTGQRYVYELIDNSGTVSRLWSTSCNNQGTFSGNAALIRQLFQAQIPDYTKFRSSVRQSGILVP